VNVFKVYFSATSWFLKYKKVNMGLKNGFNHLEGVESKWAEGKSLSNAYSGWLPWV